MPTFTSLVRREDRERARQEVTALDWISLSGLAAAPVGSPLLPERNRSPIDGIWREMWQKRTAPKYKFYAKN